MFRAKNLWIIHLLGWILFISLPMTIVSRQPDKGMQLEFLTSGSLWLFFLIFCFIFYFNQLFLIPRILFKQKYLLYAAVFMVGLVLMYIFQPFENLIFQKFRQENHTFRPQVEMRPGPPPPQFGEQPPPPPRPRMQEARSAITVDFVSLVLYILVWAVGMAVSFSRQWQLSERRAMLSEADKAQAELSFFKAQINPHFLFNTLNNIYSLAISKSEHTAPSILKLSRMMRYITEEAVENYVPLADEIDCLEDYIDLQRLRLSTKTQVDFQIGGTLSGVKIAPLIFMTFVENAFKYGVSNRLDTSINIKINLTGHEILFFCQNRIIEQKSDEKRVGIGIVNTKKRLDFLYPKRYVLDIQEEEGLFTVNLKLTTV